MYNHPVRIRNLPVTPKCHLPWAVPAHLRQPDLCLRASLAVWPFLRGHPTACAPVLGPLASHDRRASSVVLSAAVPAPCVNECTVGLFICLGRLVRGVPSVGCGLTHSLLVGSTSEGNSWSSSALDSWGCLSQGLCPGSWLASSIPCPWLLFCLHPHVALPDAPLGPDVLLSCGHQSLGQGSHTPVSPQLN